MHFEFAHFFFFLIHVELKRKLGSYIPVVISTKIISYSRQKWAKYIPVFRPKLRKNPTLWGTTYLYGLCKGEPSPPPLPREHGLGVNGLNEPK